MPEKSHTRKLRSDPSSSHSDKEVASSSNEGNLQLSERDFEDSHVQSDHVQKYFTGVSHDSKTFFLFAGMFVYFLGPVLTL